MTDVPHDWAERLRANRAEKDQFFAEHRQSPIPPDQRDDFDGLEYFEPDPDYRVEAAVTVHDDPETVAMDTSDGRTIDYERVVTFTFELDGEAFDLHAYRRPSDAGPGGAADSGDGADGSNDTDDSDETDGSDDAGGDGALFVPFRDKTTGQQTYEGGRYMELTSETDLDDGDVITVDFNLAYTPFCAFSETFACPLPPAENWLETTIEAGERVS